MEGFTYQKRNEFCNQWLEIHPATAGLHLIRQREHHLTNHSAHLLTTNQSQPILTYTSLITAPPNHTWQITTYFYPRLTNYSTLLLTTNQSQPIPILTPHQSQPLLITLDKSQPTSTHAWPITAHTYPQLTNHSLFLYLHLINHSQS